MCRYTLARGKVKSLEKMMYRTYCINSGVLNLRGKHSGVYRRLEIKVLDKDSTRQENTDFDRSLPYVII